ncbi:MAG: GNAT family N-acetyltransferase [Lachnospiraceae bacterium]|nr:GNAT family N-acetyltransferase [Lachnospiraceae bacterium]
MKIVDGKDYLSDVKDLITEYSKRLGRDLSFQHIDEELQNPAFKYTAPAGEILVALENEKVIGMVAYHRHTDERCEMKRLYVKPETRGMHLGDALVEEIIKHAVNAGYKEMVLDTIIPLKAAISLYKKHGFEECEAYYDNPMDDVIYMRKSLVNM